MRECGEDELARQEADIVRLPQVEQRELSALLNLDYCLNDLSETARLRWFVRLHRVQDRVGEKRQGWLRS